MDIVQNHLKLFYLNVIQLLGGKLAVKQQIIATASIYFKRFYLRYAQILFDCLADYLCNKAIPGHPSSHIYWL